MIGCGKVCTMRMFKVKAESLISSLQNIEVTQKNAKLLCQTFVELNALRYFSYSPLFK